MVPPRIAVIGGGPGGLIFARLLKLQNIPFRLFELDESRHSRSQGGTLDIHADSGQLALKAAGIFSEFERYARQEGDTMKILGKDGTVGWADDGSDSHGDRPEIDRQMLRKILLDSLDEGMVSWGKKVVKVQEDTTTSTSSVPQYIIELEDGAREGGFELVVGADGAWSRVRGFLTDQKPFYSGITSIEARIDNFDKYPDLAERVGAGSCFQIGHFSTLVSQRNGDGSVRTYAQIKVDEEWATTCGIDWTDEEASKKALIESRYADWEPLSKEFVLRSEGPLLVRPLYMLPVKIQWETRPGITVIGDAAHVMTPFAGVGVNLALTDALDLSHAIRSHFQEKLDWTTALRQFEEKMLARAHIEATKTFKNLNIFFSGEGLEPIVRKLGEVMGAGDEGATN